MVGARVGWKFGPVVAGLACVSGGAHGIACASFVRTCRVMGTPADWRAKMAPSARLELAHPASEAGTLSS